MIKSAGVDTGDQLGEGGVEGVEGRIQLTALVASLLWDPRGPYFEIVFEDVFENKLFSQ